MCFSASETKLEEMFFLHMHTGTNETKSVKKTE